MGEKLRMKEKKLIHQEEIQTEEMEIKQRLLEKTQIEKIIRQHLENTETNRNKTGSAGKRNSPRQVNKSANNVRKSTPKQNNRGT